MFDLGADFKVIGLSVRLWVLSGRGWTYLLTQIQQTHAQEP